LISRHCHYDFLSPESSLHLFLLLVIFFFPHSSSSILQGILFLIMSSFLSDSAIDLGDSDSEGSIQQPLMDQEIISISGSSLENTRHGASNNESSSSEKVRASRRTRGGISCLCRRA